MTAPRASSAERQTSPDRARSPRSPTEAPRPRKRKWDVPAEDTPAASEQRGDGNTSSGGSTPFQQFDIHPSRKVLRVSSEGSATSRDESESTAEKIASLLREVESTDAVTKVIDINECKTRYTLTKAATQQRVKQETGADVSVRGKFYPDRKLATPQDPPLHLHVSAPDAESLKKAVKIITDLMGKPLGNLLDIKNARRGPAENKIPVEMDLNSGFSVRSKIVGPGGAFVKHIESATNSQVRLKGIGSGFIETSTGAEDDAPLYVHVMAGHPERVEKATALVHDLLSTVRTEYERFKLQRDEQRHSVDSYRGGSDRPGGREYFPRQQQQGHYNNGQQHPPPPPPPPPEEEYDPQSAQPPPPPPPEEPYPAAAAAITATADYSAEWAAYYTQHGYPTATADGAAYDYSAYYARQQAPGVAAEAFDYSAYYAQAGYAGYYQPVEATPASYQQAQPAPPPPPPENEDKNDDDQSGGGYHAVPPPSSLYKR